ncbi:LysR family transcriptional regulator [Salicibibacter kimchii]|uniref:LysR family transcriptional regulator n=1 Tax=Salicibibacter kimchii TaxID=2099786 RepID=A0A345BXN1_9BACI|nr:LysR family transcriptional regulator [Salicibibacter kimchii]AXF55712.1 LysR family transcriptional regulator [Salicibibacter kimchii]
MDQKDWFMITILNEEKNITRTASKLYVSQPSLSYRLKKLEEEFGVHLFFKTKRGLAFTSEGEYLVQYAREMLTKLQTTKDIMKNMDDEVTGTLRIGASGNFAQYVLPKLLNNFSLEYPNVNFNVHTGLSTQVMEQLHSSSVHVGIVRNNDSWRGNKHLLSEEQLYLISKKKIDLNKLPEYSLINYHTDVSLEGSITNWWHDQFSEPPNVKMEVDRLETCKEMVKNDFGFAVVPGICLQASDNLNAVGLHFKDGTPVKRKTWLMFKQPASELAVVRHFIEYVKTWSE